MVQQQVHLFCNQYITQCTHDAESVCCFTIDSAGNSTLDDLMMHLMHTVEMFRQQLHADIAEEVTKFMLLLVQNLKF